MSAIEVVVVGGGAAGFFAAIACAEASPHAQVTLLEAGQQPLGKVRISGGGRCNVTHHCFDPALLVQHYPRGGRALRGAFSRFQPKDTVAWFQGRGVALKTEADDRMFPTTDDSSTVIDCLRQQAQRAGVCLRTGAAVRSVRRREGGFELVLRSGEALPCQRLLLATGSHPSGYRLAESLGHSLVAPVPSLFTFNVSDGVLRQLAGVAVDPVALTLSLAEGKPLQQRGPLLVTHWGFSGPAVLKLSAWGARALQQHRYQGTLQVNWLPDVGEELRSQLLQLKHTWAKRQVLAHSPVSLSRRLWQYLAGHRAAIPSDLTWANLSKKGLNALVAHLSQDAYAITGKGKFKDEFVTCGGIPLKEVNFKTLESRRCPGLFLAGEILDIDGVTGGFNFQSAWTTGWLAGQAMAAPMAAAPF